jgi:hypothetical protein
MKTKEKIIQHDHNDDGLDRCGPSAIEGNVTFRTAMSTAFPQPTPGSAPRPGPMKVEADKLRSVLGITEVSYREGTRSLAIVDETLR